MCDTTERKSRILLEFSIIKWLFLQQETALTTLNSLFVKILN